MKTMRFAATRRANEVLHIVPEGNRHALCGVVAEYVLYNPTALRSIGAGTHRHCKNCLRVTPARDLNAPAAPAVDDHPTDWWVITDKRDNVLGRIEGRDIRTADRRARQVPSIDHTARTEGGLAYRRLRRSEL